MAREAGAASRKKSQSRDDMSSDDAELEDFIESLFWMPPDDAICMLKDVAGLSGLNGAAYRRHRIEERSAIAKTANHPLFGRF